MGVVDEPLAVLDPLLSIPAIEIEFMLARAESVWSVARTCTGDLPSLEATESALVSVLSPPTPPVAITGAPAAIF